jgi:membrane-associated phospholipid phosphatase
LFIMLVYGFLAYLVWQSAAGKKLKLAIWGLLILLVLGVGASRIYLQAHWLTDVLAGYLAGLAWLTISLVAGRSILPRRRPESAEPPPPSS